LEFDYPEPELEATIITHTEPLADLLLQLERSRQDFILDWMSRIASTN